MVKIGMFAKRSAGLKMKLNRKDITTAFRTFDDRIGELIKLKSMARREVYILTYRVTSGVDWQ